MTEPHADVRVVNLLVLRHILQEVVEISLWGAWAHITCKRGVFLVHVSVYIDVPDNLARVEDRDCAFFILQLKCWASDLSERRQVPRLRCRRLREMMTLGTLTLYLLWQSSLVGRVGVEAAIVTIPDWWEVRDRLPELTSGAFTELSARVEGWPKSGRRGRRRLEGHQLVELCNRMSLPSVVCLDFKLAPRHWISLCLLPLRSKRLLEEIAAVAGKVNLGWLASLEYHVRSNCFLDDVVFFVNGSTSPHGRLFLDLKHSRLDSIPVLWAEIRSKHDYAAINTYNVIINGCESSIWAPLRVAISVLSAISLPSRAGTYLFTAIGEVLYA